MEMGPLTFKAERRRKEATETTAPHARVAARECNPPLPTNAGASVASFHHAPKPDRKEDQSPTARDTA